MPMLAAQTDFTELLEILNKLSKQCNPNEFELEMARQKAMKLREVDQAAGLCALGMIACLEDDVVAMRRFHELALRYSNKVGILFNYSKSLLNYGLEEEGMRLLRQSFKENPTHYEALLSLLGETYFLGLDDEFEKYKKFWEDAHPGEKLDIKIFRKPLWEQISRRLDVIQKSIEDNESVLVDPDPDLMRLASELIDGVEVD